MHVLSSRNTQVMETSSTTAPTAPPSRGPSATNDAHLSRSDIFKRIEDREWHKRLRERHWVQVQPTSHHDHASPSLAIGSGSLAHSTYALAAFLPLSEKENGELPLDIEFENEWEATSDWNEDDVEAVTEERELCFPHMRRQVGDELLEEGEGGEEPMDLS